jgi:sirohydrochlorin cobaltochelatase
VDEPDGAVADGVRAGLADGLGSLVALPLLPDGDGSAALELQDCVRAVSRRFAPAPIHLAEPFALVDWAAVVAERVAATAVGPDTAVVLLARAGDAEANVSAAMLARLVADLGRFPVVDFALVGGEPDLATVVRRQALLGAQRVVLAAADLFPGATLGTLTEAVGVAVSLAPTVPDGLIELLSRRRREALANPPLPRPAGSHRPTEDRAALEALDARINAILPPRYQGRYDDVKPTSMGSAQLKFGPDGKVAWDAIWTSFCDLALAGGPAHRGTLLQPVAAEEALAEPEKYREVVEEIARGVRLVTGLAVEPGLPGWVGVRCRDAAMADWLMRAIVVENVAARREGVVLYLPAGPHFRLWKEIKNVVTALAKTCHYWCDHMPAGKESRA